MAPQLNQQYNWVHDEFTPCSATCGGGIQTRTVTCRSREELEVVDEGLCDEGLKPPVQQACNTGPCEARWVEGPWSPCSKPCGEGGTRSRQVHCEKIITNGYPSIVPDKECFQLLGPKPELYEECQKNASCPTWFTGPWKPCDKLCGEGKQTRQVVCHTKNNGRVEVLSDTECPDEKPPAEQTCMLHPCDGVDWVLSDWSGCDSCLSKIRTRVANCATKDRKVVNDSFCSYHPKPVLEEPCDQNKLPACSVQWYATQWSNCSVECGKGIQQRRVFCGLFNGESVVKVDNSRCENETKYNETKPCEIPPDKCPAKWFAGPWSECTKECGGGEQFRRVMCLKDQKEVKECSEESVLESTQTCNLGPCDKDEMLPVDAKSTPIMDDDYDYEDCIEDEEEYPEVGAEEEPSDDTSSSIFDMMFSDSPSTDEGSGDEFTSFTELESEFTETGSGSEPTIETISTEEGSGTDITEISSTQETTESVSTESSLSTETEVTSSTEETESTATESEGSTETEITESTVTESEGSTVTEITGSTEETESTGTEETGSTETTGSTEVSVTETGTDSTLTTESESSTVSGSTEFSDATETTVSSSTDESESTSESGTTETGSTEYSTTESGTTETGSTETGSIETGSTETGSTETGSTETGSTETTESENTETTESASTSESSITESTETEETSSTSSTETASTESEGTTESTVTEISSTESTETTESGSTESTETTETGSTESEGTTESEVTSSTESTETTESGATETTETTESGATETTGSTETEETGSTESTLESSSTTELSTSEESTISEGSTPWDWSSTVEVYTKKPKCKPRKKAAKCIKSKFGCCPDKKTPAAGPFDEGCPNPKTCKETKHGCCPDGVSPAAGPKNKGCPIPPCNETLFGCCKSDKITPAEGNDQEGCPPPPPACKSSKYGCCKDGKTKATGPNKKGCPETEPKKEEKGCAGTEFGCCSDNTTQATGPNGEGCPCNSTQFGCCPDGVSPARGTQMEGCVMSCNTSAYGCCPDNETPAHGPDQEGCCLQYPFGCCPDNYKPAEGPHLEGCGCEFARFGCCPDNITIARGPYNEGCGCQYSEHGCCPDRHTPASGPDFAGCDCNTYQFGCCLDGVTTAKGPNLQGCLCQQTEFGCCGDGVTAATGPNMTGCDCSSSKYGCCPDGQTEAQGKKFLGCTDLPVNRQAACSLAKDRGSCSNYTAIWFYDIDFGGCSRFWYGGCEGNGNRFLSKEECEDVCVMPPPKDACKLPKVKGICDSYYLRWYYDSAREQCAQFVYGGCIGNANNFESRELCQAQCEPDRSDDTCNLSIERGSCAGNFVRWGFDAGSGRCEQFIWGGCEGNSNRFLSEAACLHKCNPPGAPKPQCSEPQAVGNCSEKHAVWSFSETENRCVPFYYTGCGGNGNRFETEQSCTEACPSAYVQDVCVLPALIGECANYREKWYYDTAEKRCRQFYYGGCGGNGNNFASERECEALCSEQVTTTTPVPTQPAPTQPAVARTTQPAQPDGESQDFCFLEVDSGPCNMPEPRWAYDAARGTCTQFEYRGCGGNRNNFPSEEYCQYYCGRTQDICQLPMRVGPCYGSITSWFYDAASDSCSQFTYGGCDGNENRFDTRDECERRCRTGPAPTQPATTTLATITEPDIQPECRISPTLEECSSASVVYYYEPATRRCEEYTNQEYGPVCRNTGVFNTLEGCERSCGAFRNLDVCRYPVDPGPCHIYSVKYYYSAQTNTCEQFQYGGCNGGPNRFSTRSECEQVCKPNIDVCQQQPDPGNCLDRLAVWYYDEPRGECFQFLYTGCNGNGNRFASREECEGRCKQEPSRTTTTVASLTPAGQYIEDECRPPQSLTPCGSNITVFHYDPSRGSCVSSEVGGCRLASTYRTEEECERRCGAFRGLDVCNTPLDTGPCRDRIPKFYWDPTTGRCYPFTYGGCHGGPNRFSSEDECEEVCGATALDTMSNEILPDCERYNRECESLRCEYGLQRTRTAGGCERCSCVPLQVDCEPLTRECEQLKCNYGLNRQVGDDGCERCKCIEHPCVGKDCAEGERCVAIAHMLPELHYTTECRVSNKPGSCPAEQFGASESSCRRECNDDADCTGAAKCCGRGCSMLCLLPHAPTSAAPHTVQPYIPELSQAPQADPETQPEVMSEEGGLATLRCLFHGNPPPKITWRRGEITIDGDVGRYRLLSDGALEIVSLYRNDSGVYICVADNGLGIAQQEVRLQVNDPVERAAGVSGQPNSTVTGELGQPLVIRCLAYGYPSPSIFWYRGLAGPMVPYSSSLYEARGNVLQIRTLNFDTLGEYACQAYNGVGKPASWSVVVQAFRPDGGWYDSPYLVERSGVVAVTPRQRTTESTTTTTTPVPEIEVPVYTVRVWTRIATDVTTLAAGSELTLPCEVEGYPLPEVHWTKDGAVLTSDDRTRVTESRLTISSVNYNDSGTYGCHAANAFSSHYSTVQISVQGLYIPPTCTDNPFFADCSLIVKSKYCAHQYYSRFCCKSCVEAGQLNPLELSMQADDSWRRRRK